MSKSLKLGHYTDMPSPTLTPHLLMIAGGSGITPMFQIIKSSVKDQNDKTKLALIYANVDESDIRQFLLLLNTRVLWLMT